MCKLQLLLLVEEVLQHDLPPTFSEYNQVYTAVPAVPANIHHVCCVVPLVCSMLQFDFTPLLHFENAAAAAGGPQHQVIVRRLHCAR